MTDETEQANDHGFQTRMGFRAIQPKKSLCGVDEEMGAMERGLEGVSRDLRVTASDFTAWLAEMKAARGWLQRDCADALGVQPRQISRWKEAKSPRYLALACAAIGADLPPWSFAGKEGPP